MPTAGISPAFGCLFWGAWQCSLSMFFKSLRNEFQPTHWKRQISVIMTHYRPTPEEQSVGLLFLGLVVSSLEHVETEGAACSGRGESDFESVPSDSTVSSKSWEWEDGKETFFITFSLQYVLNVVSIFALALTIFFWMFNCCILLEKKIHRETIRHWHY